MIAVSEKKFVVWRTCVECRRRLLFSCSVAGFLEWRKGKCIQDALPELTTEQREILISGLCGTCFDTYCGEENDLEMD